ncbi:hypothetical protein A2230_00425 [candidate division WOR-1 bacterium RIFOXYA2_FULL_36_21]|uniref:Glycosyl transferase family 1 domain-containing protein n=1 Tax=candidate division WOR-1 bacterium RIFOXYB2_FULL_36_35 TaxID=1802578 RepID=A0A1F4S7C1_UNCSA|nr:MAG: hypothetical protein A2230_00425 [candidate division WOR-1 bacterium RIFOXYA2_FULL_36_21]OGC15633.1 MAG: hypothetical protein A2290_06125 [candidate division WOR-1 bacterium RIFOXYB2_FULL_36_35]OGC16381.1 MAG: hypothetical protein A2282_00470 [candidate division WOR-1 bacterium RIFOXYA12_FULL_36_13]
MRIGIDARPLSSQRSGIGRYLYGLINALEEIDKQNEYFLYSHKEFSLPFKNLRWHKRVGSKFFSKIGTLYLLLAMPRQIKKDQIDVFWGTQNILPFFLPCKKILTVHDFVWRFFPKTMTFYNLYVNRLFAGKSIQISDCFMAVSQSTADDLIRLFNIKRDCISVVHNGIELSFGATRRRNLIEGKFNISCKYILTVGTIEPRKNIISLVKAFKKYQERVDSEVQLVVVGARGWANSSLFDTIRKFNFKDDAIRFLGHISDDDLKRLYSSAEVFVFPSLYEGFGFPPLEAMACGCPVIVSNTSSMPEVCGDAAFYINPYDIENIVNALNSVLSNQNLRNLLIEKGLNRVKLFTWEESAQKVLDLFNSVHNLPKVDELVNT